MTALERRVAATDAAFLKTCDGPSRWFQMQAESCVKEACRRMVAPAPECWWLPIRRISGNTGWLEIGSVETIAPTPGCQDEFTKEEEEDEAR
jgi:hypothetical protein